MTDLSPIAQAVSNAAEAAQCAYWDTIDKGVEDGDSALEFQMIAAATLRATTEQISEEIASGYGDDQPTARDERIIEGVCIVLQKLRAIADELEGPNGNF